MRIDRLDLIRFGPFTGVALDLAQGQQGLHVVFGNNEAGKSSALRAIADLLFGIELRSRDDFVHDYTSMRLGGTLRASDGRSLAFVRRKGNKNLLWDPSEQQQLGDDALAPFLRGLDRGEFTRVFGLDHVRLREGAHALLESGDGATAAIAGSSLGIPELRKVLRGLQDSADARWKARGSAPPINKLLARLRDAEKELSALGVTGAHWQSLREARDKTRAALDIAQANKQELDGRRAVLERVRRIRGPVATLRAARERLPAGTAIATLGADFAQRRQKVVMEMAKLTGEIATTRSALDALRNRIGDIAIDQHLLDSATTVESLLADAASTAKALRDRDKVKGDHDTRVAARNRIARQLGVPITDPALAELRRSLERHAGDPELAKALQSVHILGDVGAQRRKLDVAVARARDAQDQQLRRFHALGGCSATLDAVLVLPLPDRRWIEDTARELAGVDNALREAERALREHTATLARKRAELDAILRGAPAPDEDALATAREVRDRLWSLVRRSWLDSEDVAAHAKEIDGERALPDAVEHAVRHADHIADRLRSEADRVAKVAALAHDIEIGGHDLDAARKEIDARQSERNALLSGWQETWRALGLVALPVGRATELLDLHRGLVEARDGVREAEHERDEFQSQVDDARNRLARALEADADVPFETLRDRAEADAGRVQSGERLLAEHEAAEELSDRLVGIDRDARVFAESVAGLARRCAEDLVGRAPHDAIREIHRRLEVARGARSLREGLEGQRLEQENALREIEGRRIATQNLLRELCGEAGVADESLLPAVEEAANAAAQLRIEGDPRALEELVDRHATTDLDAEIAALQPAIARANGEIERLAREWADAERNFRAVDGTPHAAAKAQEIAELRAELRRQAEDYLRDQLAARMLAEGLERYRERNAGPVLRAASRYFNGLTRSRYTTVLGDVDEKGEPCLLVRAAEHTGELNLTQLSDGTRDQLGLALVLGSLEHRLAHREAVPLVLDDILVHFDDERSHAALEVLADFASRTQVLLFTHHLRIREQAAALGAARGVFIHHLAR